MLAIINKASGRLTWTDLRIKRFRNNTVVGEVLLIAVSMKLPPQNVAKTILSVVVSNH